MQRICINGRHVDKYSLNSCNISPELQEFLREWWSDSPGIQLQTSGSTGTPGVFTAARSDLLLSAKRTCAVFRLDHNSQALLCLPLRYIAGKMMVVRALVSGMNLRTTPPCSTPLAAIQESVDFAALVPLQAATTIAEEHGIQQLAKARTILLGGGFIDPVLEENLQSCPSAIYASYGMTETLSHIALRMVNGPHRSPYYTPLPGIKTELSAHGTLIIHTPYSTASVVETNDLAELRPDGSFCILGRVDSVINSGGIKIQAEEVEMHLTARTGLQLAVVPQPHPRLGQSIALLWEGPSAAVSDLTAAIATLPKYHKPLTIIHCTLPRTATGKINRAACKALANR